jgi:hypothetical protein
VCDSCLPPFTSRSPVRATLNKYTDRRVDAL